MSLGWKSIFLCPWHSRMIGSNKGAKTSYDSQSPAMVPDARCQGFPGLSTPTWIASSRVKPLAVVRYLFRFSTSAKQTKTNILALKVFFIGVRLNLPHCPNATYDKVWTFTVTLFRVIVNKHAIGLELSMTVTNTTIDILQFGLSFISFNKMFLLAK